MREPECQGLQAGSTQLLLNGWVESLVLRPVNRQLSGFGKTILLVRFLPAHRSGSKTPYDSRRDR